MVRHCGKCGAPIEYEPEHVIAGIHPETCESCNHYLNGHAVKVAQAAAQRTSWLSICPPIYRDTDLSLLPNGEKTKQAMSWLDGPRQKGLNLFGKPGTGKTRTMYLILENVHFGGKTVRIFVPGEFCRQCENRNYRRAPWLMLLKRCDVLAFDDVDKLTLTKSMSDDLFGVIDYRMTNRLPTFYTGNTSGDRLELKMQNGCALVRRIRESCQSIYFP